MAYPYNIKINSMVNRIAGIEVDPIPSYDTTPQDFIEISAEERMILQKRSLTPEEDYTLMYANLLPPVGGGAASDNGNTISRLQQDANLIFSNTANDQTWADWGGNFLPGIKPDWIEYHPGNVPNRNAIYLRNGTGVITAQDLTSMGALGDTYILGFYRSLEFPITFWFYEQNGPYNEGIMVRFGWVESYDPYEVRFINEAQTATQLVPNENFLMGDPRNAAFDVVDPQDANNRTKTDIIKARNVITIDRPAGLPVDKKIHFLAIQNMSFDTNGADIFFGVNAANQDSRFAMGGRRVNVLFLIDTSGSILHNNPNAISHINNTLTNLFAANGPLKDHFRYSVRIFGVTNNPADAVYSDSEYIAYQGDDAFLTSTQSLIAFDDAMNTGNSAGRGGNVVNTINNYLADKVSDPNHFAYSPIWRAVSEACDDFDLAHNLPGSSDRDMYMLMVFSDGKDTVGGLVDSAIPLNLTTSEGTILARRKAAEQSNHIVNGTLKNPQSQAEKDVIDNSIAQKINEHMSGVVQGIEDIVPPLGTFQRKLWRLKNEYCAGGSRSRTVLLDPTMSDSHPLVKLFGDNAVDLSASTQTVVATFDTIFNDNPDLWCHRECYNHKDDLPNTINRAAGVR